VPALPGSQLANSQPTEGKDADNEYLHTYASEHYLELLKAAPLWLDWQIQQIVADPRGSQTSQSVSTGFSKP